MTTQPQPFQTSVFYTIEKAIKVYRRFAADRIRAEIPDLTVNQALLLNLLADNPDTSQNEMANILFKDLAAVTRMMELLVKRDLVARSVHPQDRRRKRLALTSKGKATLRRVNPITIANRQVALADFTEPEIKELQRLLNKLSTNCQKTKS